jgi:hypothetical protein
VFIDILPTNKTFHTLGLLDSNNNIITEILIGRAYNTEPVNLLIDSVGYLQFQGSSPGSPIPVNTVQELVLINTNLDGEYLQTSAINMLGPLGGMAPGLVHNWTPIKGADPENTSTDRFSGTFDGGGKEITNLYIDRQSEDYIGLFGATDGAELANIVLVSGSVKGASNVGGIAGYAGGTSEISDCSNAADVVASGTMGGGIVGQNNASITNCLNTGAVLGSATIGGVAGKNSKTITGCSNSGDVSGSSSFIGGVVGQNMDTGSIINCSNSGDVSGSSTTGGVAGMNTGTGSITNCSNTGDVSGTSSYTGGVVGMNNGIITYCSNSGDVSGAGQGTGGVAGGHVNRTMTACYNTGTVSGDNYVGGVAGVSAAVHITACYNTGNVSGSGETGGIVGRAGSNSIGGITACYSTGMVTGSPFGGVVGYRATPNPTTITACYWLSGTANGGVGSGSPAGTSFSIVFTPSGDAWGTGTGGTNGWWKVNTTDGTQLPRLWYE